MYFDLIFLFVATFNFWIFKICTQNIFVASLLFMTTFVLYQILFKNEQSQIYKTTFCLLFIVLIFFQIITTDYVSPFQISSLQQDFQQTRMNEYPPQLARLSYWIDGKKESIIFFNLLNNFFESFDFTQYFFSKHFPFIYIIFLFIGIFEIIKSNKRWLLLLPIFASVILITIIGKNSLFDIFCLYPIIVVSVLSGLKYSLKTYVKI